MDKSSECSAGTKTGGLKFPVEFVLAQGKRRPLKNEITLDRLKAAASNFIGLSDAILETWERVNEGPASLKKCLELIDALPNQADFLEKLSQKQLGRLRQQRQASQASNRPQ